MNKALASICFVLSISPLTLASSFAEDAKPALKPASSTPVDQALIRTQKASYPLKACVISADELGKDGVVIEHVVNGRLVRVCKAECAAKVDQEPAAAIKKIDAAVIAAQKPSYPLASCPVSGAKLDDKAIDHVYGTRLVRLANADAVAAFEKDPKPAMAKVDQALIDAQAAKYAFKNCPVSGEALGGMGEAVDYLHGTTLIRFCCKPCTRQFEKDPDTFLKALAEKK